MFKIEPLENSTVETDLFINRINNLAVKFESIDVNYYIDSRFIQEAYLLFLDMIIKSLSDTLSDEERHHFLEYFMIEKGYLIESLLEKIPKY